jgi:hypothetical protein
VRDFALWARGTAPGSAQAAAAANLWRERNGVGTLREERSEEEGMELRKGMRVRELTKKVGQIPRVGIVLAVHGATVEVRWDDGHVSSLSHGFLFPAPEAK